MGRTRTSSVNNINAMAPSCPNRRSSIVRPKNLWQVERSMGHIIKTKRLVHKYFLAMAVKPENQERGEEMMESMLSSTKPSGTIPTTTKEPVVACDVSFRLSDQEFSDNGGTSAASLISDSSSSTEDSCRLHYYTHAEIRRHNTEASAWIVAGEDVYDVTDYVEHHPGGKYSIMKKIGGVVDCTQDLMFHSKGGQKYWKQFLVGKVTRTPAKNGLPVEKEWWRFWE